MLMPSPLPQWLRDELTTAIDAYLGTIPVLKDRCQSIAAVGRRNEFGQLCDNCGTIRQYRQDAKYCAGQAVRLINVLRERFTPDDWYKSPYAQVPRATREVAAWAWADQPEYQDANLEAVKSTTSMEWKDFYLRFTERERRALVYTVGCGMKDKEAARQMRISVQRLKDILCAARKKFGPNTAT